MSAGKSLLADMVQRSAERAVAQLSPSWGLATVSAVHADGTCTIATPVGPVANVRRLRSYDNPQVGDVVKVSRTPAGNWLIDGAQTSVTADPAWQSLTLASGWTAHSSYYTCGRSRSRRRHGVTLRTGANN